MIDIFLNHVLIFFIGTLSYNKGFKRVIIIMLLFYFLNAPLALASCPSSNAIFSDIAWPEAALRCALWAW